MTAAEINELVKSVNADLIESHISWVILSGDRAYKIKKPLSFSFLDFSSLDLRLFYCQQEVILNRRLSDIYLGVETIHRKGKNLFFGGDVGEIIDYCVCMKRMNAGNRMDVKLEQEIVSTQDIKTLAGKISSFHLTCPPLSEAEDINFIHKRFRDIIPVLDWLEIELGKSKRDIIVKALEFHETFINSNFDYMNERVEAGYKRDVHGDLHLQNIYLEKDPVIFDCIEFNEKYRRIDVLNEIAFLCMDLESRNRNDLSADFFRLYSVGFPCVKNEKDMALFQYYKLYRANVKVKVNGLRCMQAGEGQAKIGLTGEVSRYLNLMELYLGAL